jgi:hypothetical protein
VIASFLRSNDAGPGIDEDPRIDEERKDMLATQAWMPLAGGVHHPRWGHPCVCTLDAPDALAAPVAELAPRTRTR